MHLRLRQVLSPTIRTACSAEPGLAYQRNQLAQQRPRQQQAAHAAACTGLERKLFPKATQQYCVSLTSVSLVAPHTLGRPEITKGRCGVVPSQLKRLETCAAHRRICVATLRSGAM